MKVAYAISGIGHAAVLVWSVWSLAAKPLPVQPGEALPVDIVSVSDFTQMTAGSLSAPKTEAPKPLVEKVAEAKPVEDTTAKIDEKKEVKAAREPPPAPEAKPVETKPAETKPLEAKPADAKPEKKQAEAKPDPIAEALAKEEAKKPEPKKAEAKPPPPPKKPAPPAPKFDPSQVQALLNKQNATRLAAAGEAPNSTTGLGVPNATAKQLSLSELDALRQRLMQLWSIPAGARDPEELVVVFRIKLKPDGRLADGPWPQLVSSGKTPLGVAARESAARAIHRGQPYDMLRPENYELWKDIEITFDPRDMNRGY
jgi:outer membrane biosynthesis protein TonB